MQNLDCEVRACFAMIQENVSSFSKAWKDKKFQVLEMLEEFPRITAKWAFSRCWEITSVRCLEATQFNHLFNRKYWKKELGNWRNNALDLINDTHTKFKRNHNKGANPFKDIDYLIKIIHKTIFKNKTIEKKNQYHFFLVF